MCIKYCTKAGFLPPNMRLKIVFYKKKFLPVLLSANAQSIPRILLEYMAR